MKFLDSVSLKGMILLLEGFEFHEQIPCQQILRYALRSKNKLRSSEHVYMLHRAFWAGIPIIGADDQILGKDYLSSLRPRDRYKIAFLKAHRILSSLMSKEEEQPIGSSKMNQLLRKAISIANLEMTLREYKRYYKILNKRNIPNEAHSIVMDFAPLEFQNLGTNRLVDQLLEPPRNQSLLDAIEFSSLHFGSSITIYGAAHYGVVRDELLLNSVNPSIPNYCK